MLSVLKLPSQLITKEHLEWSSAVHSFVHKTVSDRLMVYPCERNSVFTPFRLSWQSYIHPSIRPSFCSLSFHLSVRPSFHMSVRPCIRLSARSYFRSYIRSYVLSFVRPSIRLYICLFILPSVYLPSVRPIVFRSARHSICPSDRLYVYLPIYLSFRPSDVPSIHPFIHSFAHPCVRPFLYKSLFYSFEESSNVKFRHSLQIYGPLQILNTNLIWTHCTLDI